MDIMVAAAKHADYLLKMRHYFHAHPELSGKEYNTSQKIKDELDKIGFRGRTAAWKQVFLLKLKAKSPAKPFYCAPTWTLCL